MWKRGKRKLTKPSVLEAYHVSRSQGQRRSINEWVLGTCIPITLLLQSILCQSLTFPEGRVKWTVENSSCWSSHQREKVSFSEGVTKVWNINIKWSMAQLSAQLLDRESLRRLTSGFYWSDTLFCSWICALWVQFLRGEWVSVSSNSTTLWPPVPSMLLAIVIPGLFLLSNGKNVLLHERRSPLPTTCFGSSLVLSQCFPTHAAFRPIHQIRMMISVR